MSKKRGFIVILLMILTIAFIAFVAVMQHNFTNQDFALAESVSESNEGTESLQDDSEQNSDENHESDEVEEQDDVETEIVTPQYVTASLLNVREDANMESEIIGSLTMNQEVEVEDIDDPDGWVKVTTDDFSGFVNSKYLSEEEVEQD